MSDDEATVLTAIHGRVGIATLNRPERFNCISGDLVAGLRTALDGFERNADVRVLLIRANGEQFCTGADLDEVLAARQEPDRLRRFIADGHDLLRRLEASRLPVVAATHGLALAGGLELLLACDVVIAAADARLGDQHARFGLVPGWGGSQRAARLIGLRRALDLMFSARWLDAAEAERVGLVNRVVPPDALQAASEDYCRELARGNPEGLALMKRLARQGLEGSLREGLALEERAVVDALRSDNVGEGLAAFRERRSPEFR